MSNIDFQNVLHAYVIDPHHPEKNFNLGCLYDFEGHSASALSFYLRTAELSDNPDLVYEALIRAALGFKKQGRRIFSTKSLLYHAINVRPQRPEAYWILSLVYELAGEWHEAHNAICLAEEFIPNKKPTRSDIGYVGDYVVLFQRAVTIWYVGGRDEARAMFGNLLKNYTMTPEYVADTYKNLRTIKGEMYFKLPYTHESKDKLRYKFKGLETIVYNYSQAYQDMFVLTMLDGKREGTYLEIGTADPIYNNNTYLLEKEFDWYGISIEINKDEVVKFTESSRSGPIIHADALEVDYSEELKMLPSVVDYLQIDCEPAETTYKILEKIPFSKYKFRVITYEHDYYADETKSFREKSRKFLEREGYVLVAGNIAPDRNSTFEDWWVHPKLVDEKILKEMIAPKDNIKQAEDYMFGKY